jgi:hypothetical protein
MNGIDLSTKELVQIVRPQVQHLWGLDDRKCDAVLDALMEERFLQETADGRYVLADQYRLTARRAS